jgi:hypothetical protein
MFINETTKLTKSYNRKGYRNVKFREVHTEKRFALKFGIFVSLL